MSARAHALFAAFAGGGRAEVLSCDEAYIDLRGLGAAGAEAAVRRLRGDVFAATGCTVSAGIGRNKLLARVATKRAKPDGLFVAPQDEAGVAAFLHALPAAELPGVGYWVEARLAELLLQAPGAGAGAGAGADAFAAPAPAPAITVGALLALPLARLQAALGPVRGAALIAAARGRDDRAARFIIGKVTIKTPPPRRGAGLERSGEEEGGGAHHLRASAERTRARARASLCAREAVRHIRQRRAAHAVPVDLRVLVRVELADDGHRVAAHEEEAERLALAAAGGQEDALVRVGQHEVAQRVKAPQRADERAAVERQHRHHLADELREGFHFLGALASAEAEEAQTPFCFWRSRPSQGRAEVRTAPPAPQFIFGRANGRARPRGAARESARREFDFRAVTPRFSHPSPISLSHPPMATPSAASAGDGSFFVERRHFFELLSQAVACRDATLLEPIVKRMGEIVSGGAGGGGGGGGGGRRRAVARAHVGA